MTRMMVCCLALGLVLFRAPAEAPAGEAGLTEAELQAELSRQLQDCDVSDWQAYWEGLDPALREIWGGGGVLDLLTGFLPGEPQGAGYDGVMEQAVQLLLSALRENMAAFLMIFGIALLSGVVSILLNGREGEGLKSMASFVVYGLYITAVSYVIASLAHTANEAVDGLGGFVEAAAPVLMALLAATGSTASGGLMQPLTVFLGQTVNGVFKAVILPLILAGAVITIAGGLTGKNQLKHLSGALKSLVKWMIGIVFTIYTGLLAIQGITAGGADSISIRTLKYTLDKTVPVVGSVVSGTFDATRGCAVLIKNAAGVTALIIGACLVAMPVLKIAASTLALKFSAALSSPLADERMSGMISAVADVCNYLAAVVIVVALMFVITMGLALAVGNFGM